MWGQIVWCGGKYVGGILKKVLKKQVATIQKQKTKRGSSKIVFIGAMSADVVILAVGVVLGGGRQREEKKQKTSFSPNPTKHPARVRK